MNVIYISNIGSLYFSSSRSHRVEMYGRVVQNESVLKILYKTKTYYMRTG